MRRRMYAVLSAVLLSSSALALVPPESAFTFPTAPPAPVTPPPTPAPGVTPTLTPGVWYVVESKVDAIPRVHPAGLARVTKEAGPVTIKGVFIDGNGQVETRKYTAPFLFYVEPTGVGQVEIDFIPIGLKLESEIGFRSIAVNNGQAPQPPPTPPTPPTPVPVTSFRVIFVYESGTTLTQAQNGVIYGKSVEDYLNAACTGGKTGWRRRDKDAPGENDPTMKAIWDVAKPEFAPPKNTAVPALVIQVNDKVTIEPLPATQADAVTLLKKYREGK